MGNSISNKLKIAEGMTLLTLHAPSDFKGQLKDLPPDVKITSAVKNYNQVHWFVSNKAQLEKEYKKVLALLKAGIVIWLYYPKGSSGIQTDLSRDKGWESLHKEADHLTWINLISFNETWSVFGFRSKTDADKKKEQAPKEREIFKWIDSTKKIVTLPKDVASALKGDKNAATFYDKLSFSHRKEYLEWIITARKDETRKARIVGMLERLNRGWKTFNNSK